MNTGRNDNELERKRLESEWTSERGIVNSELCVCVCVYAWNTDGINGFSLYVFLGTSMHGIYTHSLTICM